MIKARFIDKILEALEYEAGKIKIFDNTFLVYFYNTDDETKEERQKIMNILSMCKLKKIVKKYKLSEITIDYGLKTLRIETKNRKIITKNLGKYGTTGLWTMIMEILEKEDEKEIKRT